jgi:hypothetical protein
MGCKGSRVQISALRPILTRGLESACVYSRVYFKKSERAVSGAAVETTRQTIEWWEGAGGALLAAGIGIVAAVIGGLVPAL